MTELDFEQNKLATYEKWAVYLNPDQTYLGRSYVSLLRDSEDEELDPYRDTTPEERAEKDVVMNGLYVVLGDLYSPTRLNYANFRNTWHHCHEHVIPRYEGPDFGKRTVKGRDFFDKNPGRNYSPYEKVKVPEEVLEKIKGDMRAGLARQG